MMLSLILPLSVLAAAPAEPDAAWVFQRWAEGAALRPPPERGAPPPGGAAWAALQPWVRGDLFILHDAEGVWLSEAFGEVADGNINWVTGSITDAFYAQNPDVYDYVCILLLRDFGFFFAFYQPIANDTRGIGYDEIIASEVFDTDRSNSLDGLIFMNYAGLWTSDYEAGRYVFGQEFGHRWGAFTNIELALEDGSAVDPDAMLGRDLAHWSYWLDTSNSPMEGNDWMDNGDGTWSTQATALSTYSDLDMYLMGFWTPEQVGPQTLLVPNAEEAAALEREPASAPDYFACTIDPSYCSGVTITASPISFGLDAVIAAEGERNPSSAESQRSFRMAFIVLALQGDDISDEALDAVDGLRQTWEADWEEDVRGEADLITTLDPSEAPEWGTELEDSGLDSGGGGEGGSADSAEPTDTSAPELEEPEGGYKGGGCGCSAAPAAGLPLWSGLGLAAIWRRRRR